MLTRHFFHALYTSRYKLPVCLLDKSQLNLKKRRESSTRKLNYFPIIYIFIYLYSIESFIIFTSEWINQITNSLGVKSSSEEDGYANTELRGFMSMDVAVEAINSDACAHINADSI